MRRLSARDRRERRAFFLILGSGVLWALQPVFVLIIGREYTDQHVVFLFWNCVGQIGIFAVASGLFSNWKRVLPAIRTAQRRTHLFGTWVLDGVFVSASYIFLLATPQEANLLSSAVFFETWPIFAAVMLAYLARKTDDAKAYSVIAFLLFVLGFAGVVRFEVNSFWQLGEWPSFRALISGFLMGCAVVVIQLYVRRYPYFGTLRQMSAFLLGRTIFALLGIGGWLVFTGQDFVLADARLYWLVLAFGALVSLNSYFYHVGARNASSNVASLGVLISPTLAPILLFLLGYGALTQSLLAGSACIFAGIAISARKSTVTPQFLVVIVATILIGSVLILVPGTDSPAFLPVVEVLSIFYGLFQAAELSTLVSRYDRVAQEAADYVFHRRRRDYLAARHHLSRVRTLQRDATAVSEIILLSFIGCAIAGLTIGLRPADLEYDLLAYVIAITIVYLLVISWVYLWRTSTILKDDTIATRKIMRRMVEERLFSYVLVIVLLVWFFLLLLLQERIPL